MLGRKKKEETETQKKEKNDKEKDTNEKFRKQLIRVMSVIAYVSGITGPGFLLSVYFIFFWDPQIEGTRPPGYLQNGERITDSTNSKFMSGFTENFNYTISGSPQQ